MFGRWLNSSPCWDPNGSLSALAHFVSVVFCFVGCVTNVDQETCIVFGRILTNFKTLKNGLRVAPFAKANGMKRKRAALADDGSGNPKKQLKGGDLPPESSTPGSNKNQFKGYDLLQVPKEAWPQQKENKGKHGYTLTAANGAVTCSHEVNMHAIYWSEPPQYSLWDCITIHGVKHSKYSLSAYIENSPTVHSAAPFSAVLQRHLRRSNASSRARLLLSSAVQREFNAARGKANIAGQSMATLPKRGRLQKQVHLGSRLKHMILAK